MKLSSAQLNILNVLAKPKSAIKNEHPKDAYPLRTIEALIKQGLVEEYFFKPYLHGAIRLTEKGKETLEGITANK